MNVLCPIQIHWLFTKIFFPVPLFPSTQVGSILVARRGGLPVSSADSQVGLNRNYMMKRDVIEGNEATSSMMVGSMYPELDLKSVPDQSRAYKGNPFYPSSFF